MIGLLALANAVFVSGNDLYADCSGNTDAQIRCLSYVTGAADGASMMQVVLGRNTICIPPAKVSRRQIMDIVTLYLAKNPGIRHLNAGGIVIVSLREAFPCSE